MKKVVCLIAVLALTASIVSADPITITAQGNVPSNGYITIGYSGATGLKPVGFSFIVNTDGTKAVVNAVADIAKGDSFFDVFIDFASDDPAAYQAGADPLTGVWAAAHPLANTDAAGAATLPASLFAVSAAELANVATIPASGTICVLKLTAVGGAQNTTVTFAEDALRGGVVDTAGVAMAVTLPGPTVVTFAVPECLKNTAPEYTDWSNWGKPSCWCYPRQCKGDINGLKTGAYWVQALDYGLLKAALNKLDAQLTGTMICADLNHTKSGAYRVQALDYGILKASLNKLDAQVPQCDANGDGVLDAGDKYNFWTAP